MKNPYARLTTPVITFEATIDGRECFRIHLKGHDSMSALMFRGEIAEVLLKQGVHDARIGNKFREVAHLKNPKGIDFFILLDKINVFVLTDNFEVTDYEPKVAA